MTTEEGNKPTCQECHMCKACAAAGYWEIRQIDPTKKESCDRFIPK